MLFLRLKGSQEEDIDGMVKDGAFEGSLGMEILGSKKMDSMDVEIIGRSYL